MSDRWLCQLLRDSLPDHFAQCAELAKDFESALSSFEAGQSIDLDPLITSVHRHLASTPSFGWRQLHTDACMLAALSSPPLTAIAKLDTAIIVSGAADRLDIVLDLIERIQSDNLLREPFKGSSYVFPLPEVEPLTAPTIPLLEALPSFTAFQSNKHQYPFVVRNYASHWPALNEHPWASTEYLISAAGRGRVVPVEVGRDYRTDDWSQKLVEWDTFLALLDDSTAEPLYLAQHSLLMQFPSLRADIQVPDYVYATLPRPSGCEPPGNDDQLVINAWFGPRDTVSPAHTDPYYNMYVQVVGRKRVWLAPSNCERGMYADGNTSAVDVFSPDRKKHPDFEDFVAGQGMTALLDPGDLLYIPAKWWHAMRSEAARSFSISMWF